MNSSTKTQNITYSILLFLLILDFTQSLIVLIHDNLLVDNEYLFTENLRVWSGVLYIILIIGGFPLIGVVIKLNQGQLEKLNIDKIYIFLLIISGLLALSLFRYNCFAIIGIIYFAYILFDRKIKFSLADQNSLRIVLRIIGCFTLLIVTILFSIDGRNLNPVIVNQEIDRFLFEAIPISLFQEAIFRGMLFMYLRDLNFNDSKILYISTFMYWITHIHYLFQSPATGFWVVIPVLGLLLGYVTLRSKSIALSSIVHIFYNVFSKVLSLIW